MMNVSFTLRKASLFALPLSLLTGCQKESVDNTAVVPEPNKDGNYNIVFITTDQEAYIENYPIGSEFKARERMRQIGITFENHYSCSNVSTASRSAIYTGRHITETCMLDNTNYPFQPDMDKDLKTVGDMMREAGYYTAYKGKWHLSENDTSLEGYGFADWTEGNMYGKVHEGFHEDGTIAQNACNWLHDIGLALNKEGKSFFLSVNFINPHDIM